MNPRTHEAIDLGPTGNTNGNYKLSCLKNGSILKCRKWTEYPMPQQVINTANKWWRKYKKIEFGTIWNLGIALNCFDWDTEDDIDGLIEPYSGNHTELATELPGVLLD